MRRVWMVFLAVTFVGCASSEELRDRAEQHAQLAQGAAARGEYERAGKEQKKAQHDYDRAAVRAWERREPVPAPPETPPVTTVGQY